jgi:hypothetical protein
VGGTARDEAPQVKLRVLLDPELEELNALVAPEGWGRQKWCIWDAVK